MQTWLAYIITNVLLMKVIGEACEIKYVDNISEINKRTNCHS